MLKQPSDRATIPVYQRLVTPTPSSPIIGGFERILNTGLTTHFDDPVPDDGLLTAKEIRRALVRTPWFALGYLEVDSPMQDETSGSWMLNVFITDRAEAMMRAHRQGMVWNTETHQIDHAETNVWYRDILRWGVVPDDLMRRVGSFTDPAYKPLIEDYIHYKLLAERVGDAWCIAAEDRQRFAG